MRVEPQEIPGLIRFVPTPFRDDRGFFTRTFDAAAAREAGIDPAAFVQDSQSRSRLGAVRGLHVRRGGGEAKLVRCSYGAVFDVVVDLRPLSPTYGRWASFRLDDVEHHGLYIPRGCGHGWQALTEPADVCYRIDAEHDPAEDLTLRWDDPRVAVDWPLPPSVISDKDRGGLPFAEIDALLRAELS